MTRNRAWSFGRAVSRVQGDPRVLRERRVLPQAVRVFLVCAMRA
jgi:hypothetical protein